MKKYIFILLFAMGCFVLGNYNQSPEPVETHRWVLTTIFSLIFLVFGLDEFGKDAVDNHYKKKWRRENNNSEEDC